MIDVQKTTASRFIVLLDDGTGRNRGHHYGTYKSKAAALRAADEAESLLAWCVGAWVERVPKGYIHDPALGRESDTASEAGPAESAVTPPSRPACCAFC